MYRFEEQLISHGRYIDESLDWEIPGDQEDPVRHTSDIYRADPQSPTLLCTQALSAVGIPFLLGAQSEVV